MAYLQTGQNDAAQREYAAIRTNFPFASIADWPAHSDYQDRPQTTLYIDALRKLGLPEN